MTLTTAARVGGLGLILVDFFVSAMLLFLPMDTILSGADYLALPAAAETFIIEPLLPVGGVMTLYGDPKVGKSFAAIQLAIAIATGGSFLGFPTQQRGKVVYVQLDTPRSLWQQRLKELEISGEDIQAVHFADRETLGTYPFDIMNPEHFNLLRSSLAGIEPTAVIIDTLKEAHQLDENDATESQKVIAALTAATQPAALILVHHGRKPQPDRPDTLLHGARGSLYLIGRMDAILHMSKRSIHYTGRAIEEGSFRIERLENGFWSPATDEIDRHIERIIAEGGSGRQQAKKLAEALGRSEEACRSLIRRHLLESNRAAGQDKGATSTDELSQGELSL